MRQLDRAAVASFRRRQMNAGVESVLRRRVYGQSSRLKPIAFLLVYLYLMARALAMLASREAPTRARGGSTAKRIKHSC
jgi:hypothetical protein